MYRDLDKREISPWLRIHAKSQENGDSYYFLIFMNVGCIVQLLKIDMCVCVCVLLHYFSVEDVVIFVYFL